MKKIILSVIAVLSLLAPVIIFQSVSTIACPEKDPETLLSLYRNSETIHVGRYRSEEKSEPKTEDEDYSVVEIKRHFDVSSTLKGKAAKDVTLIEQVYIYKAEPVGFETMEDVDAANRPPETAAEDEEEPAETDGEEWEEASVELKPGDHVLLFLRKGEESGGIELTDYGDGLKNLPPADIAVYEARIKELAPILAPEKPDVEKIVDWLVRCAEDPVTRWEGTYELERSFNALEYKNQRAAERRANIAKGENVEDEKFIDQELDTGQTIIFAKSLNEYQKQTLANILLNSEFQSVPKKPGEAGFVAGNRELMSLVSRWADARIAGLFISRLRGGAFSAEENSAMMNTIATIVNDKRVSAIAEQFTNIYYEGDGEEVSEDDLINTEEADAADETAVEPEEADTAKPEAKAGVEKVKEQKTRETRDTEPAKKAATTYKQFRADLISRFLLRVDEVMLNPEARVRSGK